VKTNIAGSEDGLQKKNAYTKGINPPTNGKNFRILENMSSVELKSSMKSTLLTLLATCPLILEIVDFLEFKNCL